MGTDWDDDDDHDDDDATRIAELPARGPVRKSREKAYLVVLSGSNVGEMYKVEQGATRLGRSKELEIQLRDDGISRAHCEIVLDDSAQLVVRDLESRNGTFVNGARITAQPLADGDKIQLGTTTILKFSYHDELEATFQKRMMHSALRDGLTEAYNKRYFLERLQSELGFALRHRSLLTLIMLDLDHFKRINDTHGHLAGDAVLAAVSDYVQNTIRSEDVFARYGGEEFAIITRAISREDAMRFAERVREGVSKLRIDHQDKTLTVTCSLGVATVPEAGAQTAEELVQAADSALYEAKNAGRNRVVSAL